MAEAFIVRRGGGGSGGTLVVTSSGAGTVTVSNSILGKSYSKNVTAGGSVTFKGLKTGEWTVTLSNGAQTTTRSVTINADYSVSVAYFSATISITYPATSTCVVTNSGGQTVASDTNTGSSTKTWTATVNATGTYTVTATSTDGSGKSKSQSVSITAEGQSESVTLRYYLAVLENGVLSTLTGGIDGINDQTSFTQGKIVSVRKNSDGNYFTTKGAINVTDYSTLYIRITYDSKTDFLDHYYGLTQNKIVDGSFGDEIRKFKYYKFVRKGDIVKGSTVEITVDISSAIGDYYIAACTQDAWKIDTIRLLP